MSALDSFALFVLFLALLAILWLALMTWYTTRLRKLLSQLRAEQRERGRLHRQDHVNLQQRLIDLEAYADSIIRSEQNQEDLRAELQRHTTSDLLHAGAGGENGRVG